MAEQPEFKHILRVINTDLDGNKSILQSLRKIKGVSHMFSNAILAVTGVSKNKKTGYLEDKEVQKIEEAIKNPQKFDIPLWLLNRRKDYETGDNMHLLSTDLTYQTENDLKRLKKIKSYRGVRHMSGLPVRGQRTKANFRRNKGKVATVKKKGPARK